MKIEIGEKAIIDLEEIYTFSYNKFGESKANEYAQILQQQIGSLSDNPLLGTDYSLVKTGLRRLVIESHCVFYQIQASKILIYRILHQSQDVQHYL